MLPESRNNSAGRMSAPCQDAASKRRKKAHDKYQVRLRLTVAVLARSCKGREVTEDMGLNSKQKGQTSKPIQCGPWLHSLCSHGPTSNVFELLQRCQFLVNIGQLGLLFGCRQGGVAIDLVALGEQIQLTDGFELVVGRGLETRQF